VAKTGMCMQRIMKIGYTCKMMETHSL